MLNKELQTYLQEFPDEMQVMIDRNGCIYTEASKPQKKLLNCNGKQEICIVLSSPIPLK